MRMKKMLLCMKDHSIWIYAGVAATALILFLK